jgi:hypothetical protein
MGPPLSGASAVVAALQQGLTGCHVTETAAGTLPGANSADVVVFVVSAVAPMAGCDAALLDGIPADAVVGAVAKIDVHRTWRAVAEANRSALARYDPGHRFTPWVGVAADPQIGSPVIGPLVDAVRAALGDSRRGERRRSRAADADAEYAARRQAAVVAAGAQRNALRAGVRQARLDLSAQARARTVSLRAELQRHAAMASHRDLTGFDEHVRRRVSHTADEFADAVRVRFAEVWSAGASPGPDVSAAPPLWGGVPPPHPPGKDSLAVVFATTFGLGVALTLGRLLVELAGAADLWALVGCGAVGLALTMWVIRVRRLVAVRLAADRWIGEVSAVLRSVLEERVLAAESSLLAALAGAVARADRTDGRAGPDQVRTPN